MQRAGLTAVLAVAATLMVAPTASAADVTVNFARDGGSKTVSLGALAPAFDVNGEYRLVSASGQTTTRQINGISLRALLDAVDADPTFSAVTITRPGGGVVRISRTQIEAGGQVPVIYAEGGLATFVRPAYATTDRNADDVVSAATLTISQVDGTDYNLKAKAAKSTLKVGERVKFTASAVGAAGQKLVYTWNFNDGTSGRGESVTHQFKKRGYYRVLVSVRGEGETASVSTVVRIQVGKAVKSKKKREGGGTNDAAGAPVSGRADGSSGSGAVAGPPSTPKPKKPKRPKPPQQQPEQLEPVVGELLDDKQNPQQPNDLAARSGQQVKPVGAGNGIPTEVAGGAVALGLLAFGAALEFGLAGRLRRRTL